MRKYRTAKIIIGLLFILNGIGGFIIELMEPSGVQIGAHKLILIAIILQVFAGALIIIGKGYFEKK